MAELEHAEPGGPAKGAPADLLSFLTGAELLCLLPAPVAPPAGIGEDDPKDPAAAARNERPLTAEAVREAVSAAGDPLLDWLTRTSLALSPYASRGRLRITASHVYTVCVIVPFLWIAGVPHGFGRRQLAATTAVAVLECLAYSLLATNIGWLLGRRSGPKSAPPKEPDPEYEGRARKASLPAGFFSAPTLDTWAEASFWRYLMLCQSTTDGLFLEHSDRDWSDCCCPRGSCAGAIPRRAGLARIAGICSFLATIFFSYVTRMWTPLVTLGGQLWTSAWAIAGVLWIVVWCNNQIPSAFGGVGTTDNIPARELEQRLAHRAVRRSLEALVGRLRDEVAGAEGKHPAGCESWCADLVPLLASRWKQDVVLPQWAVMAGIFFGTEAIAIIIFVTTGNCLPLYTFAQVLTGLFVLMYALLNASFGNARITGTAALLRSASLSLARLELAVPDPHAPLARRIAAHRAVLGELLEVHVEGAGVRLFGTRVTAGLARKVVAATATALFAVWTVFRALGVVLTMELVCPAA
ncbi:hypothetical protein DFJ74DRAFT_752193 [Hyaloraphidium curvatum]|nr:hypothetical protein DFJ74DRAFT_752193 [Hyaloraphidium curvatum]